MRIIAPMMILIMMTSTLAGCTGGDPDSGSNDEITSEIIQNLLESDFQDILQSDEPEWINDVGDNEELWNISLSENQWFELKSNLIFVTSSSGSDYFRSGSIRMEESYKISDDHYSPIFGGNYSLCWDECQDGDGMGIGEVTGWSVIYRIHNVTGINHVDRNESASIPSPIDNTNITMQISYVPNGMSESDRTTALVMIELYTEDAPNHVDSFLTHIENGNYDNAIFHRIIDNFMIQGGDFEFGSGTGGYAANWYGYCNGQQASEEDCSNVDWTLPDEANNGLTHNSGAISMAKTSAANTGGSQFFIVPSDSNPSHLNGVHTVFGYVTSGLDQIDLISEVTTGSNDRPIYDVSIINITIDNLDN
jgi:cyclophilin family peptidyl-prolyl cis-trans isomerase